MTTLSILPTNAFETRKILPPPPSHMRRKLLWRGVCPIR